MNLDILHKEIQDFISKNLDTDITELILKGSPFPTVSIQEIASQIVSKNKAQKKIPTWFNVKSIYYPPKLNIEQTSSELTANYKTTLIQGESILDLTGGFGVDCYAFSKKIKHVTHCELHAALSEMTHHNYKQLGVINIKTVAMDGLTYLQKNNQKYDWIYIDPSRRDDLKQRVFLLKDCLPNLPKNLNLLFKYSDNIMVKTAPLLDIKAAISELNFVKDVHIIAINNEVKEVLYLLEKGYTKAITYKTINLSNKKNQVFNFTLSDKETTYSVPKKYLFEPNAAILKAGAFQEIAIKLGVDKLHKHSHLYTFDKIINFPGRRFKIQTIIPFNVKKIKQLIADKKANITTRNFPETVTQIRKKTKLKDGGNLYLFFTTDLNDNKIVLFCEKI